MIGSVAPGANNPRHDLPRVEIGQARIDGRGKKYLIADCRFIRTGTFGAGYLEFLCLRMNPEPDTLTHEMQRWIKEKIIQECT